ncbi:MAG: hypothetical protein ACK4E5_07935 [Erythrobacter cryptus]
MPARLGKEARGRNRGDAEGVDMKSPDFARNVWLLPAWPAGGLVLSAGDLWRFGRALAAGRLVRPETLEAMMAGGIELRAAQGGAARLALWPWPWHIGRGRLRALRAARWRLAISRRAGPTG